MCDEQIADMQARGKCLDEVIAKCQHIMKREEPSKNCGWGAAYYTAERILKIATADKRWSPPEEAG